MKTIKYYQRQNWLCRITLILTSVITIGCAGTATTLAKDGDSYSSLFYSTSLGTIIGFQTSILLYFGCLTLSYKVTELEEEDSRKKKLEASREKYKNLASKSCNNCLYHHGQKYNDTLLICAVHPEGVEGTCPDYEEFY
ncbi:MAG: hypothetical protein KME21_29065 [Desmonostoc vinosum HA7617-LM4]|jgi:hypothetical protein|nr:hypothetical protein [Desmonostoc vinosum HA7617-LM4]